ncbi:MAG: tripartite tricarboxylate transporter TctB family protein, partial [Mailhella sp.]|nr:tripartite tricarboxylate transporter TctB family protein [Mailhella sp.]
MLKGSSDIWTGVGFLAIAGAFFAQYPESEGVSRIFPETLMSLIALGGVYYLIRGLLEHRYECGEDGCAGENWQNIFWVTFMS